MGETMRRSDCEIRDHEEIMRIIKKCAVMRIRMTDEDGYAYIVPVNFGFEVQGQKCTLYFHSALEGKKSEF